MKRLIILLCLIFSAAIFAQIKYVPTDYPIIQDAIDACQNEGDIVIIEEGTYYQQFDFKGKAITVASRYFLDDDTSHISRTIIDGSQLAENDTSSLVFFWNGENENSVLCGLTLQHGKGSKFYFASGNGYAFIGGAVCLFDAGGTIRNNIIRFNKVAPGITGIGHAYGGGVESVYIPADKKLIIADNVFYDNLAEGKVALGGGLEINANFGCTEVTGNIFESNKVKSKDSGYGGGVCIYVNFNNVLVANNHVTGNTAIGGYARGGGVYFVNSRCNFYNNLITYNRCSRMTSGSYPAKGGGLCVTFDADQPIPDTMQVEITNNTITRNFGHNLGGGIYVYKTDVNILNNIVRENDDAFNLSDIWMEYISGYDASVTYCNVRGGHPGVGNIDVDPNFADTVYFRLSADNSQSIDAGNPASEFFDVASPNNPGSPRAPAFGTLRNDMGAYGGPNSKWCDMIPTKVEEKTDLIPETAMLYQNYPNPFNPTTTIKYNIPTVETLPSAAGKRATSLQTELIVYTILGEEVATLVNETKEPGIHEVEFNGKDIPSGVYFYKLRTGNYTETKKMILIK